MNQFMEKAIELAEENVHDGKIPFGAVLVKDNKIVAEAAAGEQDHPDVTGHAEVLAIRKAQKQLHINDLSDYTIYTSGEPCSMCMTAIYTAGIETVYFYNSLEQMADVGMGEWEYIYNELSHPNNERSITIKQDVDQTDRTDPMQLWYVKQ